MMSLVALVAGGITACATSWPGTEPAAADPSTTVDLDSATAWTYQKDGDTTWTPIAVPGDVYLLGSGKKWVDFTRSITIPDVSSNQVTLLTFGSIDDGGQVYIDGNQVGASDYALFPVKMDISSDVLPGETYTLTIRAFDYSTYYGSLGQSFPDGHNYYQEVGVPRGAGIEVDPAVTIRDSVVHTSVANDTISYDLWVQNGTDAARTLTITATLSSWNESSWTYPTLPEKTVTIPANSTVDVTSDSVTWGLGSSSYWWPNLPYSASYVPQLHMMHFTMEEGATTWDTSSQRFGFVEYTEGPSYYEVNGTRIMEFIDSTQEWVYNPKGTENPDGTDTSGFQIGFTELSGFDTLAGAKQTFQNYMKLGINTLRLHTSAATETMLNAADEVGFMLIGESAARGDDAGETSGTTYFEDSVKAMIDTYRQHPSISRYSLANEWDVLATSSDFSKLVDAAYTQDTTKPFSFSDVRIQDGTVYGEVYPDAHATRFAHYYEPDPSTTELRGVEEDYWNVPSKHTELVDTARAAVIDRNKGYAVFGPWTLGDYWPNFVDGASRAANTYWPGHVQPNGDTDVDADRTTGVDGWDSPLIDFVQNSYAPQASADLGIYTSYLGTEAAPIKAVPLTSGQAVSRDMVMFNNTLQSSTENIAWELHWDSPTGTLVASGTTPPLTLAAGESAHQTVNFTAPVTSAARTLYYVVKTEVGSTQVFEEDGYHFAVSPSDLAAAASSISTTMGSEVGYPVANLTDNDSSTAWVSGDSPTAPGYVTVNWATPQDVSSVSLSCTYCQGQGITNFDVETSVDGSTGWTEVGTSGTVSYSTNDTTQETKTVGFTKATGVEGLRIKVNSANLTWLHTAITKLSIPSTDNLADIAAAVSTTLGSNSGYPVSALTDGSPGSAWESSDSPTLPGYLTVNWAVPQDLSSVTISCNYCQGQGVTGFDVQTSVDGSTGWNTAASSGALTYSTNDTTEESKTVGFPRVTGVLGVRLKITSANLTWAHTAITNLVIPSSENIADTAATISTTLGSESGHPIATLTDSDPTTAWVSADDQTYPGYITLNWAAAQDVSAVTISCNYCQGQGVTGFDVQTSVDGSTGWTTAASSGALTYSTNDTTEESRSVGFPGVSGVRGVRLKITSANLTWAHAGLLHLVIRRP